MFFYEGQICPVCGKHFAESDDIVACPACGCPHHRECWKQEGQCHFAADHGTDRQWAQGRSVAEEKPSETPTRRCPNCGAENPEFAEFCARCGRDLECEEWESAPHAPHNQYTPPTGGDIPPFRPPYPAWSNQPPVQDPYGGLSPDERIGDFTAAELAEVVGTNATYYLPRFKKMTESGSKISWNNAAFFFSHNWLLYRKNILWGIVFFAAAFTTQLLVQLFVPEAFAMELIQLSRQQRLLYGILSMAELALSVLTGLFGNFLYMLSVFRKARKNRENQTPLHERSFLEQGGVSFALFFAPALLLSFATWLFFFFGF